MLTSRKIRRPAVLVVAALAVGAIGWAGSIGSSTSMSDSSESGATGRVEAAERRDPWLRPFTSGSIWNMPVGSAANYRPANLPYTKSQALETSYLVKTTTSDPKRPLMKVGSWRNRCSGTKQLGTIHLPNGWQPKPVTGRATPNNPGVFLQPDGRTLVNVGAMARCSANGALYANRPGTDKHITDLYGDGRFGAHGASRLSQLGGAIRPGELSGERPIQHALDLLIHSEHLYWGGTKESSFRWPASSSDRYAGPARYRGSNPELRMGSLLAIPPGATPESLGITTDVGRRLFDALQDYGAYVTDDSAWDATYLGVDSEAIGTFPWGGAEKADMARMVTSLNVITNNGPGSIGGGGEPRQPLLPELDGSAPAGRTTGVGGADNDPVVVDRDPLVVKSGLDAANRIGPPAPVAPTPDPAPSGDTGDVIFRDDFDGASGASLEGRARPAWSVIGGEIVTRDGAAIATTARGATLAVADAGTADVTVASSITLSSGRAAPGLAVRTSGSQDGIVMSMVVREGHNRVSLHAVRNGRYTLLAEVDDAGLRLGSTYDVVLRADGARIEVELDGRRVLDHQLASGLVAAFDSNDQHGLRIMRNSVADDGGSRWNDVVVSRP